MAFQACLCFLLIVSPHVFQTSMADDMMADDEYDDEQAQKVMLALLGHAKKPNPNKANVRNGATDGALNYMFDLYKDVVNHDRTHNETHIEVDYFMGTLDFKDDVEGRNKRETEETADTAISFITENKAARPNATDQKGVMYFDLRTDYDTSDNLFSELRLFFKDKLKSHTLKKFKIALYEIKKPDKNKLIVEKSIERKEGVSWISLNITKVVCKWLTNPSSNHGLFIRAKNQRGKLISMERVGIITPNSSEKKRPFIVMFLKTENPSLLTDNIFNRIDKDAVGGSGRGRGRSKREIDVLEDPSSLSNNILNRIDKDGESEEDFAGGRSRREIDFSELMKESTTKNMIRRARIKFENNKKRKSTKACKPFTFEINFKKLNWNNWIMAPTTYKSKYCDGSCTFPINKRQNATSHALIQSLQNLMSGGEFPEPCCAPYEMAPLHVFLFDKFGNAVIKEYPNMRVVSCGCQ